MIRLLRWTAGIVLAGALVATAACSGHQDIDPIDVSGTKAAAVACNKVRAVSNAVSELAAAPERSGKHKRLENWGLNPDNAQQIEQVRNDLKDRADSCRNKTSGSPSPSATPGENKAEVTNADGSKQVLPLVAGGDPANPESGPQANSDPRTPPVAVGKRTDTWGSLDTLLGNQKWYTSCANKTVGMNWKQHVPAFIKAETPKLDKNKKVIEKGKDTRFILVINSTVSDARVRAIAAKDNPYVGKLHIQRVPYIINTRGLERNQCSEFVYTRPQVRVTLGKLVYNKNGTISHLNPTTGTFVDCHNPWRIPKAVKLMPKPKPPVSVQPSKTPPCKYNCKPPPPPPPGCKVNCKPLEPKKASDGAAARDNVTGGHTGTAPQHTTGPAPAGPKPPPVYNRPPPPPPPAPAPRPSPPPPPPPDPEPTEPYDPCKDNPGHPACG